MKVNTYLFVYRKFLSVYFLCFSFFIPCYADQVSTTGNREWGNISALDQVMLTVESKVCALQSGIAPDFSGTFTMLAAIEQKACTVDSKLDVIDGLLDPITLDLQTIESKVDVVDNLVQSANDTLSSIRVDDFGGTWTAIDGIQLTLCGKFDTLFNDLDTIDQQIDIISGAQLAAFLGTCTMIESISDNVAINMSLICEIAIDVASDIDSIDSLLDMLQDQNITIDSKLDAINVFVDVNFAGTFTALESVESKACILEQKVCALIDQVSTATVIQALEDKACTIDSKLDALVDDLITVCDDLETIQSFIDLTDVKLMAIDDVVDAIEVKATTINTVVTTILNTTATTESKVDQINPSSATAESKLCIIDSKIDLVIDVMPTLESKVDLSDLIIQTIDSKLDTVDALIDPSLNKICTIESKVDVIDHSVETIASQLDLFVALESKIDVLDQSFDVSTNKACTIDSKVDVINGELISVSDLSITIDSKVELLCLSADTISSKIDVVQLQAVTLESKIDQIDISLQTIFSKICTLDSKVDVIEMETGMAQEGANRTESILCELVIDFQETWTVLNAIELKSCTADSLVDRIESKVEALAILDVAGEFDNTFTALAALEDKVCSVESQLDFIIENLKVADVSGTFTALEASLDKSCTIDSKVDVASVLLSTNDSSFAEAIDCLGTEITSADIGTTGYTISASGRYFLGAEIDYAASAAGNPAITISADNVTLDLCDKTLRQSNAQAATEGIVVSATSENITIKNGAIREFSDDCIQIASGAAGVTLQDLRIISAGGSGIDCVGAATNIMINRVLVTASTSHGLEIAQGADIVAQDSLFVDNTLDGINIDPSTGTAQRICILRCMCNNNSSAGIELNGSSGTLQQIVIDSCCIFTNGVNGIDVNQLLDSVIKNNVITSNTSDGISMSGASNDVEILNNVISNNTVEGIHMGDSALEDCSIQGNILVLNGSDNYREDVNAGPHTVLTNFAINVSAGNNFSVGAGTTTTINEADIDQGTGTFSTTPGKWRNISMTT